MRYKLFTSESVTIGHPDKICDQISDAVLDSILEQDPNARGLRCRGQCGNAGNGRDNHRLLCGYTKIARQTIKEIGYTDARYGFDYSSCAVLTSIDEQSSDIAMGVLNSIDYKESNDPADLIGAAIKAWCSDTLAAKHPSLCPCPLRLRTL